MADGSNCTCGIKTFLRARIKGLHSLSEVQLADAIVAYHKADGRRAVYAAGQLWTYSPPICLFKPIEDAEIASHIYDLDGAFMAEKRFRASAAVAGAVLRIVKHRLSSATGARAPRDPFLDPSIQPHQGIREAVLDRDR